MCCASLLWAEMKNRILSLALARIRRSGAVEFSRSFYSMLCTAVTAAAARKRSIGGLDIFATNIHTYIASWQYNRTWRGGVTTAAFMSYPSTSQASKGRRRSLSQFREIES